MTQEGNRLSKVLAQAGKAQVGDPGDVALCEQVATELDLWRKACATVVQQEEQNKQLPEGTVVAPLSLPGGAADWEQVVKKSTAARQALQAAFPKREPKAKAAPKAEGGPPEKRRRRGKSAA